LQCGFVRSNFAFDMAFGSLDYAQVGRSWMGRPHFGRLAGIGAGDGNRTHTASLEGWSSTIELHPRREPVLGIVRLRRSPLSWRGGGGRIRTYVRVRGQIYSLLPLTTRPPLRNASKSRQTAARREKVGGSMVIAGRLSTAPGRLAAGRRPGGRDVPELDPDMGRAADRCQPRSAANTVRRLAPNRTPAAAATGRSRERRCTRSGRSPAERETAAPRGR
jgi:hypothetical protein